MINGPLAFSFFTLVHAAIALLALRYVGELPAAALCLFLVEAVTAFDNAVTVAGNRLGINARAERLNRARFFLHAVCIGLLVPVYTAIGITLTDTGSWQPVLVTLGWVVTLGICIYGYAVQYRGTRLIMPVNYYGCLRYAQSVNEHSRHPGYDYSEVELAARGHMPFASIVTTLVGLLVGLLLGVYGDFWVLFITTALMFLAGGFPLRTWGPFATSCLEVVFSGGLLYSLAIAAQG